MRKKQVKKMHLKTWHKSSMTKLQMKTILSFSFYLVTKNLYVNFLMNFNQLIVNNFRICQTIIDGDYNENKGKKNKEFKNYYVKRDYKKGKRKD